MKDKVSKQNNVNKKSNLDSKNKDKDFKGSKGLSKNRGNKGPRKPADEFEQKIIDIARVTRVTAGGKRMKFRACVVVGDKKSKVGVGIAKGSDVTIAINKAVLKAKKNLITVPIVNGTIPHQLYTKFGSAKIFMKPGRKGNRIKAGGVVKMILDISGIEDIVAKILGCNNKINNAQATIKALNSFIEKK